MFVSYSASYDWLLLARPRHYHYDTYYYYKPTHAQMFGSGVEKRRDGLGSPAERQIHFILMQYSWLIFVTNLKKSTTRRNQKNVSYFGGRN